MGKTTSKKPPTKPAKAKAKPTAAKKPASNRGKKNIYRPEFAALGKQHCILGARNEDLAALFGVSRQSIDNWLIKYPKFKADVFEGREKADIAVASSLFRRAIGYDHNDKHYPADTTACIFWLKNRRPDKWRDKVDVGGEAGGPIKIEVVFEDQEPRGPVTD